MEKVGAVKMSQIERTHMLGAAPKILGVKDTQVREWDDEKIVTKLNNFFVKAKVELVTCDRCGGGSDKDLTACPYCGDIDEDDEENDDEEDEPKEEIEMIEVATERHSSNGITHIKKKTRVIKAPKVEVIAKGEIIEGDLDFAIAEVHRLCADTGESYWKLGEYVRNHIYDGQLWTLRKDENGKPRYKSFNAFVKEELDLSSNFVYAAMKVSAAFPIETAREVGRSHLRYILGAPKEDHEELVQKVRDTGLSVLETKMEVGKRREVTGKKHQNILGNKETPVLLAASAKKKLAELDETKSIAIILSKRKRAISLKKDGDDLVGIIEGSNGVNIHVLVTKDGAGNDSLVIYPKRDETEE